MADLQPTQHRPGTTGRVCNEAWDELFPAEQARIVEVLVERVEIGMDGLNVRLRVDGLSGLAREMLAGGIGEAA